METSKRRFGHMPESGASSVEYGLLVAFIAAVIVIAVISLGSVTTETFSDTCTGLKDAVASAGRPTSASC